MSLYLDILGLVCMKLQYSEIMLNLTKCIDYNHFFKLKHTYSESNINGHTESVQTKFDMSTLCL